MVEKLDSAMLDGGNNTSYLSRVKQKNFEVCFPQLSHNYKHGSNWICQTSHY
jgi:hypothetical protein